MPPKKGKKDKGAKSDLSSLKNDEAKMKAIEEAKAAAKVLTFSNHSKNN